MSTFKAAKATIFLGDIPLDIYQLPDGNYVLYASSVTEIIKKHKSDWFEFLSSKNAKSLPSKELTGLSDLSDTQVENRVVRVQVEGRGGFISAIPVPLVAQYWLHAAFNGNPHAQLLITAIIQETIELRADRAFGRNYSEEYYNARLADSITTHGLLSILFCDHQLWVKWLPDTRKWLANVHPASKPASDLDFWDNARGFNVLDDVFSWASIQVYRRTISRGHTLAWIALELTAAFYEQIPNSHRVFSDTPPNPDNSFSGDPFGIAHPFAPWLPL